MRLVVLSLLVLLTPVSPAAAEELRTRLRVWGSQIDIQIRHEDGRPAVGLPIRILYGRQLTTAVAHTDQNGNWSHQVGEPGAYLAVIENGTDAENPLRLPFTVLSVPERVDFPWTLAVPFVAALMGASFALAVGIKKWHRQAPLTGMPARNAFMMAGLMTTVAGLLGWSAWHQWTQAAPAAPAGPDVAGAARSFLLKKEIKPLSAPLTQLLAHAAVRPVRSQTHPLWNQPAPDFELRDQNGKLFRLSDQLARGPVVLVFYYGYHCNHCVAQLFAVHDDIRHFRDLGAQVLAISADPPEMTRDRFKQYGEFAFPVLSDPDNTVGQAYGVYRPASGTSGEDLQHGTFIISRDGRVRWVHTGYEPFTGNGTLLHELAR